MASLTAYTNNLLKAKGLTVKEAKAAGSVYYTKMVNGKPTLMVAAYAEDLKTPIKETQMPPARGRKPAFIPKEDRKKMPTTSEGKKKVVKDSKLKDNQKKMLLEQIEANEKRKKKNSEMNKGGIMKKKGYAKGGSMKKKGYAMGGMMPMNEKRKVNPTTGLSMNKGGMSKKKKGYAKGGMTDMRKSGMFKGGMTKKK